MKWTSGNRDRDPYKAGNGLELHYGGKGFIRDASKAAEASEAAEAAEAAASSASRPPLLQISHAASFWIRVSGTNADIGIGIYLNVYNSFNYFSTEMEHLENAFEGSQMLKCFSCGY
jgi:succinyl-CoA synthetase beta subunit